VDWLFGGVGKSSSHVVGDSLSSFGSTPFSLNKTFLMGVRLVNLVEELECTSWGTVVIGYSDLYRVGVLSVDIVRRGCFPLRASFLLFRSHSPMHTPTTMTTTGMTTARANFAVVESPALPEGEVSPGLPAVGSDPLRRGSSGETYEALAPLMLNGRL
jgi:hypothetical protein